MLTLRTLKIVGMYSTFINNIVGCTPFSWNPGKQLLYVKTDTSYARLAAYFASYGQALGYMAYLLWQACLVLSHPVGTSIFEVLWLINWINSYVWQISSNHSAWVKRHETVTAFNKSVHLFRQMSSENKRIARMAPIICTLNIIELYFLITIFMMGQFAVATVLMFLVVPGMIQYVYAVVDEKYKVGVVFVGFVIFEGYSKSSMACVMGTVGFNVLMGPLGTNFWLRFTNR